MKGFNGWGWWEGGLRSGVLGVMRVEGFNGVGMVGKGAAEWSSRGDEGEGFNGWGWWGRGQRSGVLGVMRVKGLMGGDGGVGRCRILGMLGI